MIRGDLPGFPKLLATRGPQMASGLILHCCWMLRIFIIRLDDDKNEENYVLVMVSIGKLPKNKTVFFGISFPNVGGWGG